MINEEEKLNQEVKALVERIKLIDKRYDDIVYSGKKLTQELWEQLCTRSFNEYQQIMCEYDKIAIKRAELKPPSKPKRTIAEQEDIIINKYGGKKLDLNYFYNHLTDYFGERVGFDYLKKISPCGIIFQFTEELIPEEYFYSFYFIPIDDEVRIEDNGFYKEQIAYITTRDGVNVYISSIIYIGVEVNTDLYKKICSELCYYAEGIASYIDDIK